MLLSLNAPDHLSQFILAAFNITEAVTLIEEASGGVNSRIYHSHWVARTQSSTSYGFKVPARGVTHALENEKLAADLGGLLNAPHASPVRQLSGIDVAIPQLGAGTVNITQWVRDSKPVNELNAAERTAISHDCGSNSFFYQYGEWMAFGLFFGIRDRHGGNFMWNPAQRQLCMIDLEDGFTRGNVADYGHVDLMCLAAANPTQKAKQRSFLVCGFNRMYGRAKRHETSYRALLINQTHTATYQLQHFQPARWALQAYLTAYWA